MLSVVSAASADEETSVDPFDFDHVSCNGGENEIRVVINRVKQNAGQIAADLYPNDEEGFLHSEARITQVRFAAKSPVTAFCITPPEPGQYAIALYHDKNANKKFDKSPLGMPAEPWGISNNPKILFSAPPVEKALFEVNGEGAKVEIKLN